MHACAIHLVCRPVVAQLVMCRCLRASVKRTQLQGCLTHAAGVLALLYVAVLHRWILVEVVLGALMVFFPVLVTLMSYAISTDQVTLHSKVIAG
jgi:hypothetical protein